MGTLAPLFLVVPEILLLASMHPIPASRLNKGVPDGRPGGSERLLNEHGLTPDLSVCRFNRGGADSGIAFHGPLREADLKSLPKLPVDSPTNDRVTDPVAPRVGRLIAEGGFRIWIRPIAGCPYGVGARPSQRLE